MMHSSSKISRLVTLAVLLTFFGLIWLAILAPLAAWKMSSVAQLEAAQQEASRLQASIQRLQTEKAQLASGDISEIVWAAPLLGEATARIQARVSELASQEGLALRSITPIGERDFPLTGAVALRLEAEAPLDRLTNFFIKADHHTPVILINQANIRRLVRPGETPQQPLLFVQVEIVVPVDISGEEIE